MEPGNDRDWVRDQSLGPEMTGTWYGKTISRLAVV